jgi:hypothetical protein
MAYANAGIPERESVANAITNLNPATLRSSYPPFSKKWLLYIV